MTLSFSSSLPDSPRAAGYVEAVKVGVDSDREFFDQIEGLADALNRFDPEAMNAVIYRSAELHVRHISTAGDPFEFGSARPLDFGHWAAHKLKQLSDFRVSHAEAVAIGIALDVVYSRHAGHLPSKDADRILALLTKLRFHLFAPELLQKDRDGEWAILRGLAEFQQHIGGELAITLLREIGKGFETHEISTDGVRKAIEELRERFSK